MWGTWPVDELSLRIDEKTFNQLRRLGAFDVWIAQSQPPTSRQGQTDLQEQLKWLNASGIHQSAMSILYSPLPRAGPAYCTQATMQESHNDFVWHDLSTQTLRNPAGNVLAGCDPGKTLKNMQRVPGAMRFMSGIGCTYPTQKLVVAQFGFAAEAPMYGSVARLPYAALSKRWQDMPQGEDRDD